MSIPLGTFFAWAYIRTGNIWVPTVLHFFNNNLILVYAGTAQLSGQVIGWGDVLVQLVVYEVLFLPFLASGTFREGGGSPDGSPARLTRFIIHHRKEGSCRGGADQILAVPLPLAGV